MSNATYFYTMLQMFNAACRPIYGSNTKLCVVHAVVKVHILNAHCCHWWTNMHKFWSINPIIPGQSHPRHRTDEHYWILDDKIETHNCTWNGVAADRVLRGQQFVSHIITFGILRSCLINFDFNLIYTWAWFRNSHLTISIIFVI